MMGRAITAGGTGRSRARSEMWVLSNLAAGLADAVTAGFQAVGTVQRVWLVTRPTRITAMSIFLNTVNASPAGSVTISIFKNGVDTGTTYDVVLTPSGSTDQGTFTIFSVPLDLVAMDKIDLRVTTTAGWNSTTGDIVCDIEYEA